jgi:hypothetical protein
MGNLEGGCLCGAVRYEAGPLTGPIIHCHCSTCRKAHGSAFASTARVARAAFRWVQGGESVRSFESSPGKRRHFCPQCGSQLMAEWADAPEVILRLGSLDGDPGVRPIAHIWTELKAPWYEIGAELRQFPQARPPEPEPPRGGSA